MSLLAMNGSRGAPVRLPIYPQLQTFRAPPLTSGYDPLRKSRVIDAGHYQGRAVASEQPSNVNLLGKPVERRLAGMLAVDARYRKA